MDAKDLLLELYGRLPDLVDAAVDGLDADQLGGHRGARHATRSAGSCGTSRGCRTITSPSCSTRISCGRLVRGLSSAVWQPTRRTPATAMDRLMSPPSDRTILAC